MTINTISFMPVIGVSASAATLVGNAVGEGQPRKAKQTIWTCVSLMVLVWTCVASAMAFGKVHLASVITKEAAVKHIMYRLICIWSVVGFVDSSQNVMGGAL